MYWCKWKKFSSFHPCYGHIHNEIVFFPGEVDFEEKYKRIIIYQLCCEKQADLDMSAYTCLPRGKYGGSLGH